jgi:hypothetical protein
MTLTGFDDNVIDVSFRMLPIWAPKALRISLWKVAHAFFKPKGMQT